MDLSEKTKVKVSALDTKLNMIIGREACYLGKNIQDLLKFGKVEVGWRESCGSTDLTIKVYREWKKILILLKNDGFVIAEKRIIHGNSYATNNGGFWNSIIYTIA